MNVKQFFFTQMLYAQAVHDMIRPAKTEETKTEEPLVGPYIKCLLNDNSNKITIPNELGEASQVKRDGWIYILLQNHPNIVSITKKAFQQCDKLTKIVLPGAITHLDDYAMTGCINLKSINLENILNVSQHGLEYCHALTSINLPNVITLGDNAIRSCNTLATVHLGNNITDILSGNFTACSKLTSLTIDATTPPTLEGSVFAEVASDFKIIVPAEAVTSYKEAPGWKDHADKIISNNESQSAVKKSSKKTNLK